MQPGETVFVTGAAGGVGLAAVDFAHALGARVIAGVGSDDKLALVRQYGAEATINYRTENLRERIKALTGGKGVDVCFDNVGGAVFGEMTRLMNWGGRLMPIGFTSGEIPSVPMNLPLLKNYSIVGVFTGAWGEKIPQEAARANERLMHWVAHGRLRPHVSRVLPLEQAAEAMASVMDRRCRAAWCCASMLPTGDGSDDQDQQRAPQRRRVRLCRTRSGARRVVRAPLAADCRIWDEHAAIIGSHYRVLAPSQRYFGVLPWPDDGISFSVQTHATDLATFVRALGLPPVTLIGWSYGGAVCLAMSCANPDLVGRLFLYEPSLATFVTDPSAAQRATDDRLEMVHAAKLAAGHGDLDGAVENFMDDVNGRAGTFHTLTG